jgi:hypothetical protein
MVSTSTILQDGVVGQLTAFDRLIFRGHLTAFFPHGAVERYLNRVDVLTKDFKDYVLGKSGEVIDAGKAFAASQGRPYEYLQDACTRASGDPKAEKAVAIAERDDIRSGLVCVFSTLEPCLTFQGKFSRTHGHPEIVSRRRKCLHLYFYLIDPEFGLIHVRLQTWFPFQIQVYVNGREWLSRVLDRSGIGYQRYENCFVAVDDLPAAQGLAEGLAHRRLAPVLDALAQRVNPLLPEIARAGFGSYYWCIDQAEIATDIMFRDRPALERVLPDLYDHALRAFCARDVMRFLGRKLHPRFLGEVITRYHQRPEGRRVRHWAGRNSIKMYDKLSVLRIETTINNPRDFKILKSSEDKQSWRWSPMGKGVSNLWHYSEIGTQANRRYLDAMDAVQPNGEAIDALDDLCRSRTLRGRRVPKFHPVTRRDCQVFSAVLDGGHLIYGFRNRDIARSLFPSSPTTLRETKRRAARVSRLIAKLRGHHLVARVPRARLYRVTPLGFRVMSAALRYRTPDFPNLYAAATH